MLVVRAAVVIIVALFIAAQLWPDWRPTRRWKQIECIKLRTTLYSVYTAHFTTLCACYFVLRWYYCTRLAVKGDQTQPPADTATLMVSSHEVHEIMVIYFPIV